jgi:hypothetical protein
MMEYNYNDLGHVLCVAIDGKGKVLVVRDDLELLLPERAEAARQAVQDVLDMFARIEKEEEEEATLSHAKPR